MNNIGKITRTLGGANLRETWDSSAIILDCLREQFKSSKVSYLKFRFSLYTETKEEWLARAKKLGLYENH